MATSSRAPFEHPLTEDALKWEIWHKTRNKPVKYTCRCGEIVTLLGGFTPEEIEKALVQAYEVYGFGLEGIESNVPDKLEINVNLLSSSALDQIQEQENLYA